MSGSRAKSHPCPLFPFLCSHLPHSCLLFSDLHHVSDHTPMRIHCVSAAMPGCYSYGELGCCQYWQAPWPRFQWLDLVMNQWPEKGKGRQREATIAHRVRVFKDTLLLQKGRGGSLPTGGLFPLTSPWGPAGMSGLGWIKRYAHFHIHIALLRYTNKRHIAARQGYLSGDQVARRWRYVVEIYET